MTEVTVIIKVKDLASLKELVRYKGGVKKVAEKIDIPPTTLFYILSGKSRPLAKVVKICSHLGVKVEDIKEWNS